ncbi:MAG TPA: V-type ATPase subunit, partial [Anaerolineaceae bacterium]|nr:V-type ATPase subunit [Anaerolineaceae bacterium]
MTLSSVSAYANVHTRVRGMIGNLLSDETIARLSACPDLGTLIAKLDETSYASCLAASEETIKSSRRAAYEIRKKLTRDYKIIIEHAPSFARQLLVQLFRLYEVDNLKAVLRGIEVGEDWEKIRYTLFPVEDYPTLPFADMVQSGTVESAIALLHNTDYEVDLKPALTRYHDEESLFPVEVAIDLNYWQRLWDQIDTLPKQDQKITRKLIGMMVDKNNLTWAARYRVFHRFSESEIINYTLPFGYKIDDSVIRAIAADRDPYQLLAEIYPAIAKEGNLDSKNTSKWQLNETIFTRMIYSTCRNAFSDGSFSIGLPLAYLLVLEFEIQDLTLLFEAKSLEMPVDQ